jgi:surface protein
MYGLFAADINLLEVDLSKLDVSSVTDMRYMFYESGIRNIDLKNLKTSSLILMISMFEECHSLVSLDLSSFNTERVTSMKKMFYNCKKLNVIDLSNFSTSALTNFESMFENGYDIEFINFKNYNEGESGITVTNVLKEIRYNIVVCIKEEKSIAQFKEQIELKLCPTIYCEEDWREHIKRYVPETGTCEANCLNYKYEGSDNKCY